MTIRRPNKGIKYRVGETTERDRRAVNPSTLGVKCKVKPETKVQRLAYPNTSNDL